MFLFLYSLSRGFRMPEDEKEKPRLDLGRSYRSYVRDIRERNNAYAPSLEAKLFVIGFVMTIVGMLLAVMAPLLGGLTAGSTSGAIIFIGFPFLVPIGVAWGPYGKALATFGALIALIVVAVLLFILHRR